MLSVQKVCFEYVDNIILKQVSFSVIPGTILHITGENGAGKTTLLKLIAGLMRPTSGDISWNNESIYKNSFTYAQQLCYVGHKSGLSPALTVKENCELDVHWQKNKSDLQTLLTSANLGELTHTPCHHLSLGQRRRVALLRLSMTDAPLWLLDEPLVGLDKPAIALFISTVSAHIAVGGMVVMTSHQMLASYFSTYIEYSL